MILITFPSSQRISFLLSNITISCPQKHSETLKGSVVESLKREHVEQVFKGLYGDP